MTKNKSSLQKAISLLIIFFCSGLLGKSVSNKASGLQIVENQNCRIVYFNIKSDAMNGREIRTWVLLPPAYINNETLKLPVLYALHGRGAPFDGYSKMKKLLKSMNSSPMIVAGFDGDKASWYLDAPNKEDSKFTTFFFEELIPTVETNWRSNGKRAITGFSMGGFGAMHLALTKPELFSSVSGFSSALSPIRDDLPARLSNDMKDLFGPELKKSNIGVLDLLGRLDDIIANGKTFPPIYEHCGTEDYLVEVNRNARDRMVSINAKLFARFDEETSTLDLNIEERRIRQTKYIADHGIDFRFIETPGGHDWLFWHGNIAELLAFHYCHFNDDSQ